MVLHQEYIHIIPKVRFSFRFIIYIICIADKYQSLEQVQQALRKAGLKQSNLVIGIDYTKSNEYTGQYSFGGKCLHSIKLDPITFNPYQQVISIIGRALEPFDDDNLIPTFGFGDSKTTNVGVFPFFDDKVPYTFAQVLSRYMELAPQIELGGPTNFAPLIYEAISIVKKNPDSFHILVIIADGQVTNEHQTLQAIIEASFVPLSIVVIGVGDGPWEQLNFETLSNSAFDNYHFINFEEIMRMAQKDREAAFAMHALAKVPEQLKAVKKLGYIK